jgi:hypothetical protein
MSITYEHYRCACCGELTNADGLMDFNQYENVCSSCWHELNEGKTFEQIKKEHKDLKEYNTREAGLIEGRKQGTLKTLKLFEQIIRERMTTLYNKSQGINEEDKLIMRALYELELINNDNRLKNLEEKLVE